MSPISTTVRSIAACACLLALAPCAVAAASTAQTLEAAARLPGTPKSHGPGVIVRYRPLGTATVGKPFPVTVDFSQVSGPDTPPTTVRFTSDAHLPLSQAKARKLPEGSSSITVVVTPTADGPGSVNVFTRRGTEGSATTIPIQVGTQVPGQKSELPPGKGPNGEPAYFHRVN